jgi:hypothetical protein
MFRFALSVCVMELPDLAIPEKTNNERIHQAVYVG